jgi:multiple sugar transport system ATP-binding protein
MPRVVIENLSRTFEVRGGQIAAVRNANLTVEEGEFLVLAGPSGSGKTVTLRLIAGLEEPSAGTVAIDGKVINDVPARDRDIAMVFQNYALYPHMSVYENLAFGLKLRKFSKPEIERRVQEAAEMLELTDCLQRWPAALSGGQRQRVALGRALVRRPRLFLLDEPLSGLDPNLRAEMRAVISRIQRQTGSSMLYVTHDQIEAMMLGDRIAVMKEGAIQQVAAPLIVYRQPANHFVAGFFGVPPMNFLKGKLVNNGSGFVFEAALPEDSSNSAGSLSQNQSTCEKPLLLKVPPKTNELTQYSGKEIILGIRPEDIRPAANEDPGYFRIEATAQRVEELGAETHVHLAAARHSFVARLSTQSGARLNGRLAITFDMHKAHFFDPVTGHAIN